MDSDDRMATLDWFPAHMVAIAPCSLRLRKATVFGAKPFQQLLDRLAQELIRDNLTSPASISTGRWHLKESEDCHSWWLMLVADVRVVPSCGELGRAYLGAVQVVRAKINAVEFDVVFHMGSNGLSPVS